MTTDYKLLLERLQSERERLIAELEQIKSGVAIDERREGSPFGKREEEATETLELEKRLAMERRVREHITSIEHALDKFDKKTYGLCDNCGQPIDPDRLEALPQASLCLNCKAQQAKNAKAKPPPG